MLSLSELDLARMLVEDAPVAKKSPQERPHLGHALRFLLIRFSRARGRTLCGETKVLRNSVASAGAFSLTCLELYCSVKLGASEREPGPLFAANSQFIDETPTQL